MKEFFENKVKNSILFKNLPSNMIVPRKERDPYYSHFTVRVKNLAEYIDIVGRLTKINNYSDFGELIFRGHSDASSNYKLIPTIGRKERLIEYSEGNMVAEMITLRPEDFLNLSNFELLSKLQHFGIPTRLLDFTYNPLIAMYFACCSDNKTDSRIVCASDTSSSFTNGIIETICGMYKYMDYNAISLDRLLGDVSEIRKYALHSEYPFMAKPKYSNDRIKHQSAVFMVFPNAMYDYRSRMVVLGREKKNEEEYRKHFVINDEEEKRLEYVRKEPTIYEDHPFYVNSKTLNNLFSFYEKEFDDFKSKTEFGINPKYHYIFKDRFSILNSIQELTPEQISNSFVSVLIERKYRKNILSELSSVGIDKAFVFPELEYTAEMVKNKFF